MDVVIDGMMVINSRIDPEAGSEDLQTWSWGWMGVGGTLGNLLAGILLSDVHHKPHPYLIFWISTLCGIGIAVSGLFIDKELEENQADMVKWGFLKRTKFVTGEIWKGLKLKEVYTVVIFQTILGCVVPTFGYFLYAYYINVALFSQFQYSMIKLIGYITLIVGSACYNIFLKKSEFRVMLIIACFVNCFGSIMTTLFILHKTLGIDPYIFVMMTNTVTDTLHQCFT